ncbi:hypothetical protein [Parvularcula maris]|uniref:DUF3618 domain-containing protein n=1 Tax=Parvularcula maris TaxID=2965077 RepID=A0A9X2L6T9_9PROT|nr:hypothetical protein [Parvularcula maris]MCQ8184148.1 hypothetical protein [Parvularcula maris]
MTQTRKYDSVADAKRHALASDLAELKDRLRATDLIGTLGRQIGVDVDGFKRSTGADSKTMPYALIGVGTALLAGRYYEEQKAQPDTDGLHEDDYHAASDIGLAHRRLRRRENETDDLYARRTYEEYGRRLNVERYDNEDDHGFFDRVDDALHGLSARVKGGARATGSAVSSAGSSVAHGAAAAGRGTKNVATSIGSGTASAASSAASGTRNAASATKRSLSERARWLNDHAAATSRGAQDRLAQARMRSEQQLSKLKSAHEDNPAVGTGLGMALGLLLGALTPPTNREKRATDGLADALMDAAQGALAKMNENISHLEQQEQAETRH